MDNTEVNKQMILYGLVSFGSSKCGETGIPAVYTNIEYFIDWIKENIKPWQRNTVNIPLKTFLTLLFATFLMWWMTFSLLRISMIKLS